LRPRGHPVEDLRDIGGDVAATGDK
jgi:hypothetical protein